MVDSLRFVWVELPQSQSPFVRGDGASVSGWIPFVFLRGLSCRDCAVGAKRAEPREKASAKKLPCVRATVRACVP